MAVSYFKAIYIIEAVLEDCTEKKKPISSREWISEVMRRDPVGSVIPLAAI